MGLMDEAKDKMSELDDVKARVAELKSKEKSGDLDDKGRAELERLRGHDKL